VRRLDPTPRTAEEGVDVALRLMDERLGLKLLLAHLPPGSTLDDALALHRRLRQRGRRPCSFLER